MVYLTSVGWQLLCGISVKDIGIFSVWIRDFKDGFGCAIVSFGLSRVEKCAGISTLVEVAS